MPVRIQVVLDEAERAEFRRQARLEGQSLSAWLKTAGKARIAEKRNQPHLLTQSLLRPFSSSAMSTRVQVPNRTGLSIAAYLMNPKSAACQQHDFRRYQRNHLPCRPGTSAEG